VCVCVGGGVQSVVGSSSWAGARLACLKSPPWRWRATAKASGSAPLSPTLRWVPGSGVGLRLCWRRWILTQWALRTPGAPAEDLHADKRAGGTRGRQRATCPPRFVVDNSSLCGCCLFQSVEAIAAAAVQTNLVQDASLQTANTNIGVRRARHDLWMRLHLPSRVSRLGALVWGSRPSRRRSRHRPALQAAFRALWT
jgi:hypothetical protein